MGNDGLAHHIRETGWRQGSVIPADSLPDVPVRECEGFLLISQSCDVVHGDFKQEPVVELLPLHRIPESDGNRLYGKNPRVLHIEIDEGSVELLARERFSIPRQVLAKFAPATDLAVSGAELRLICEWLSKRYVRPAFPDAFNTRILSNPQGRKIRRLFKHKGRHIESIWVGCSPHDTELPDGEPYKVVVWFLMRKKLHDDPEIQRHGVELAEGFEEILSEIDGIDCRDCSLKGEHQVTLDDARIFVSWDFDDLTHREELKD